MRRTRSFLLLIAAIPLAAQNYTLSDTVLTADSGLPIPGAPVIAIQKTAAASQPPLTYKKSSNRL